MGNRGLLGKQRFVSGGSEDLSDSAEETLSERRLLLAESDSEERVYPEELHCGGCCFVLATRRKTDQRFDS